MNGILAEGVLKVQHDQVSFNPDQVTAKDLLLVICSYLAPVVYQNTMGLSRNLSLILGGCTAVTYMFVSSHSFLWLIQS